VFAANFFPDINQIIEERIKVAGPTVVDPKLAAAKKVKPRHFKLYDQPPPLDSKVQYSNDDVLSRVDEEIWRLLYCLFEGN
jgi:hypothetical protein